MKKSLFLLLIFNVTLLSCDNDDENNNTDLIGIWRLQELSIDPGDGSGTFQNIDSNKTIEFKNDGSVTSNGEICDVFGNLTSGSNGTFSEETLMITTSQCNIRFEKNQNQLIIFNFCEEPCRALYRK